MRSLRTLITALLLFPAVLPAQDRGAVLLHDLVRGLGTNVRVLMVGAHPDDEDTQLLTWLARGRRVETAYLSLTRGDGGQNLIGNELGEALGVIRTEELLAARRMDGARQYFTRAFDFGFSKSAEETFEHWPRDTLLRDVVAIVRAFRPHVIVSVFSGTPRDGHGHHQVAGMLAREVFDAAADTVRFPPRAVGGLGAWTPLKFYRGVFRFQGVNPDSLATLKINVGEYDPVLGRSYAEIAGESRSQHRSQAFGSLQPKGVRWAYLQREASRAAGAPEARSERDLFDGIDTTWGRFAREVLPPTTRATLDSLPAAIDEARRGLDLAKPWEAVSPLARVVGLVSRAQQSGCAVATVPDCGGPTGDLVTSLEVAHARAARALVNAAGVSVEAFAARELVALGDSVPVSIEIHNRGRAPVGVVGVALESRGDPRRQQAERIDRVLPPDSALQVSRTLGGYALTIPWWRARPRRGDMFQLEPVGLRFRPPVVADSAGTRTPTIEGWTPAPELLSGEDRVQYATARVTLEIDGVAIGVDAGPVVHRFADPAIGEIRRPVAVVPPINVLLERGVEYMRAGTPVRRQVRVHLSSALTTPWTGRVELRLPAGLRADTAEKSVTVPPRGEADVYFMVQGRVRAGLLAYDAAAHTSNVRQGISYSDGYVPIEYPHIRTQRFYRPAQTWVSAVDVDIPAGMRVAYVPGVGDNVPPMLQQLGIPVTLVHADTLAATDLSRYSTLVIGPRAYEANAALRAAAGRVLGFARRGGTVVTQYGQYEMTQPGILPYAITLGRPADRVTEEDATVRVLDPASPLLAAPNRIGEGDFAGWVQERALYMPRTFGPEWRAPLAMHDDGQPAQRGGLLVAPLGRGTVVYTTLSFFRQLPSGIPGPARLFVNLLAAKSSGEAPAVP